MKYLDIEQVSKKTGLSVAEIKANVDACVFPQPFELSAMKETIKLLNPAYNKDSELGIVKGNFHFARWPEIEIDWWLYCHATGFNMNWIP